MRKNAIVWLMVMGLALPLAGFAGILPLKEKKNAVTTSNPTPKDKAPAKNSPAPLKRHVVKNHVKKLQNPLHKTQPKALAMNTSFTKTTAKHPALNKHHARRHHRALKHRKVSANGGKSMPKTTGK